MSEYLPEEVLAEIFLRLPIKSIIECTSVCKSWYSLITSPSFISSHLNYQDDHLLVRYISVDPQEKGNARYCYRTPVVENYALYSDNHNFDHYAHFIDLPPKWNNHHFNIVGSCNGLLCLSDDLFCYPNIYYLWNPSIRKSVKLPKPIFTFRTHGPFDHTLGFGFDSVASDYKVVRIVDMTDEPNRIPPNVELYKLSTGVWQDITHVSPAYRFFEQKPGVYLNGACHWVTLSPRKIVLFDVQDETFREMMLPGSAVVKFSFRDWFGLFVSEESLCFADPLYNDDKTIDIWRMKVYGDSESWVKHYSVNSHITFNVSVVDEFYSIFHGGRQRQDSHFLVKPLSSRRNGEILWIADNGNLVSYDIATKKVKNLGIHNANFFPYDNALYISNTYKVSLVLLDKRTDYLDGDTCEEYGKKVSRKLKYSGKHKMNYSDDDDGGSDSRKRKKRGRSKWRKSGKERGHSDSEVGDEDKDPRKRRKEKRRKRDDCADEDEGRHRRRKSWKEKRGRRRSHRHADRSAKSSDDSPPRHKHRSRRAASAFDSDGKRVGRERKCSEKRSRKRYDDEE